MIDLTLQPCCICGQTQSRLVHGTTYPEHHYPSVFSLRQCEGCGLMFNSPRLDARQLEKLYGENYYFFLRRASREFDRIVAMYQRTVGLLDSQIPARRSIDIGCGRGYFPAVLRQLGWDAAGIEISPSASQSARSKLGLDVFTGTVEQYAASPQASKFGLVTAIDVIEHVPSPDQFVAAISRIVEPGGKVIIDTPNAAAGNIARQGVCWKGFNPFHIYLFTIQNLTLLLGRHGLAVQRSFSYGNTPSGVRLRDRVAKGLKKIGLLSPAVSVYFGIKKLTASPGSADPHLANAVARIKNEPPYSGDPDSSAPLAHDNTGDNIVMIATKVA